MSQRRDFSTFVVIGAFAAGVNFFARLAIDVVTSFGVAIVVAYLVAMTMAFVLNRRFVFPAGGRAWQGQYVRFAAVNVIALIQVFVVSVGLARYLLPAIGLAWHDEEIAHAIGLASPIVTSYWGHKYFSFSVPATAVAKGLESK